MSWDWRVRERVRVEIQFWRRGSLICLVEYGTSWARVWEVMRVRVRVILLASAYLEGRPFLELVFGQS